MLTVIVVAIAVPAIRAYALVAFAACDAPPGPSQAMAASPAFCSLLVVLDPPLVAVSRWPVGVRVRRSPGAVALLVRQLHLGWRWRWRHVIPRRHADDGAAGS